MSRRHVVVEIDRFDNVCYARLKVQQMTLLLNAKVTKLVDISKKKKLLDRVLLLRSTRGML